ncbi:interferon regulatory factor 3 isoform X2 [Syngnathoides biaculeatus]|uniref:interferon regulatory factor 3 isoform X2 n=1 Tax=Syngnathoides biaculeatus TaxID=300417 RepID=UPI002ADDEAA2|nr:interferon regulatory factor 3 isoform X2 [Syngnathoides biaculeatus]
MAHSKPLLIQWLRSQIDSGVYPGVHWTNQQKTEFCIPWKHALRQDSSDADIRIFKAWANVSGNGRVHAEPSVWKRNFRCALRAKNFKMIADNKNDTANPHKVFRWPDESTQVEEAAAAAFALPPEQQEPQRQPGIGGRALPWQQPHPVAAEGAVGEAGSLGQPVHPVTGAVGGACEGQLAKEFLDNMNKTKNGDNFKTQFRVAVYYRGENVSEQVVANEAGFRLIYRPGQAEPVLDQESGLTLISLPSPVTKDQTQARLTQRILENLGEGLEVGVSGAVIYGQRRGDVKAFWSFSKFEQSGEPQEISKLQPHPLYSLTYFIHGILDFIELDSKECGPCSLVFCLGEKWPDPGKRPWTKKLIVVEVVLTSMELLKNIAMEGGASSLKSVDLQMSLEEMIIG